MTRPITALLMTALVSLAAVGCSGGNDDATVATDATAGADADAASDAATDAATDAAPDAAPDLAPDEIIGSAPDGSVAEETDDADSGRAEVDAAVEKILAADPSIEISTARCVVATMIADGTIGMGEVLAMDFFDLTANADRLQTAYADAAAACS